MATAMLDPLTTEHTPDKPRAWVGIAWLFTLVTLASHFAGRFGTDWAAWKIAASYIDCSLFTIIVLRFPLALVVDGFLARWNVRRSRRALLACVLGVLAGYGPEIGSSSFEFVIGVKPPAGVKMISDRHFTTAAGGGEENIFIQFQLDPAAVEKLMRDAKFSELDEPDIEYAVRTFGLPMDGFRYTIDGVQQPAVYVRSAGFSDRPNDFVSLLWDPALSRAHAKRIRG